LDSIALISDIHGNMPALDAVLADIDRRGIERIICLGDLVGKGPDSVAVVDFCASRCEAVVRGNWDDGMATAPNPSPSLLWHRERLGPDRLAYLATLPNSIDLTLSGHQMRLLHASPQGVYRRVHQADPIETLESMFENTEFTGYGSAPDVVGYADIHSAYVRTWRQRILFNVGSVGNPLDMTLACYAILEGDSGGPGPLSVSIVRVPYDIERAIADAEAVAMPELEAYAKELRTAVYRGRTA
jgi:predicted phosphodiesterase